MRIPFPARPVALALSLACFAPSLFARDDVINVTGSRAARTADQTLASVTVIDRAAIERSQALSVIDLIDGLAGITAHANGGFGTVGGVHLRGANSGHVLVLIDGVRASSATLGTPPWHTLSTALVERVEIVRGPRSHLYGSEAIGGVIQIFTRRAATAESSATRLELTAGSHDSHRLSAGTRVGSRKTRLTLDASLTETNGFDATVDNNPDDDGSESRSLAGSLSHRFSERWLTEVRFDHTDQQSDYDGWQPNDDFTADYIRQALSGALHFNASDDLQLQLTAGHFRDEEEDFINGSSSARFETERTQLGLQGDLLLGDRWQLIAGTDWSQETVDGSSDYAIDERDQQALFTELQGAWNGFDLSAGLRHDDFEHLDGQFTGNLAFGLALGHGMRLTGMLGSAFKAPTFNDLYYLDPWGSNGNPELDPEQSTSGELGLSGSHPGIEWDLRIYQTDVDDLIQWSEVEPWVWSPQNLAEARIRGLELSLLHQAVDWSLRAELTLLDAVDRSTDLLLPLRSPRQLRVDYARTLTDWEVGATWLLRSSAYSDTANTQRLAGFGLVDLRGDYRLDDKWRLRLGIKNLFDRDYREVSGYNTAGRELFLSLLYNGE